MKNVFLNCSKWGWLVLLVIALMVPFCAQAQMAGTGAISGTVTDATGAVIPNASVTALRVDTNVATVRLTTSAGDYNITPLDPGLYTVTVTAKGFEKYVQENVTVNALQTVAVNIKLTVGSAEQSITVTAAPPVLETTDAQLGAVMDNEMYSSLPLLMGYSGNNDQRRATDFGYLMPGVQNTYAASSSNNPTDATGGVNGGNPAGGTQEIYIDGVNLPQADGVGDPRFTWTAFGVDAIDQFQVESSGYSAQYAGQGVQNYSIKQGGNKIHGSLYEYIRNTRGDAWGPSSKTPTVTGIVPAGSTCSSTSLTASTSWCALGGIKPAEIQNEYGIVISGPIIKNKLFLFYNYGQYRNQNGPKPKLQTVPTLGMMGYSATGTSLGYADFSGYSSATAPGTGYAIYDPGTQNMPVGGCTGNAASACNRTQFAVGTTANQIPGARISAAAAYYNKFMLPLEATANQSIYGNNITAGYHNGLSNWYQSGRLDYNQSEKHQISLIIAFGRQASTGFAAPPSSSTVNELPPPFNTVQSYTPKTNVDILKDTYTINSHTVNQFSLAYARYKSLSTTADLAPQYSPAASGLLNVPAGQSAESFPALTFSGGADAPNNEAGYSWNLKVNNTYGVADNLQWQHGMHSVTMGGQVVEVQFNYIKNLTGTPPMPYTFKNTETQGYSVAASGNSANGAAISSSGATFASYMLGAVDASAPSLSAPELGSRWLNPSLWLQDDVKVNPKLTLNLGVRWDIFPSIKEAHDQFTWLNPTGLNTLTGNLGTLSFAGGSAGDGAYTGLHNPSAIWYKNVAPRLGLAYAIDHKTVIRASYDVNFARGDWTSGSQSGSPSTMGLVPAASAPSGISSAPSFYWDGTQCAAVVANPFGNNVTGFANDTVSCGWTGSLLSPTQVVATLMPAGNTLAEFGTAETAALKNTNNGSVTYFDPYLGSRTPEYLNWTIGIQRELTRNMSVTVSYVGSEGHFISVSKANGSRNGELPEAMAGLAAYTTTGAACSGLTCTTSTSLLSQKATTANVTEAQTLGYIPPNPFASFTNATTGYYQSNSLYQYYQNFPQYSGVSDTTSFVGNENWNALEVTVRERPAAGLNFMVNYTWSKSIDDLGTFRVGDNNRLDRSLSAASQPQNLVATAVYQLPLGRNHRWGDNFVYRSIASDWQVSGIGLYHSGLPILATGSGCAGNGILNQCMPNIVPGVAARQYSYGKTASGAKVSWDPNSPNYIGTVQYINPAAFTVTTQQATTGGTTGYVACTGSSTTVCNGQAIGVGAGSASYAPGNAGRVAPLPGMWGQPTFNLDMALKRTFPLYHDFKLAFEADMSNVTNHVVYNAPGAAVASGTNLTFGTITGIQNQQRLAQLAARISW